MEINEIRASYIQNMTSYIFSVAVTVPSTGEGKVQSNAKHIWQFIWKFDIICSRSHNFSM